MMSRTKAVVLCALIPILLLVLSFVCWPHFGLVLKCVWPVAASITCIGFETWLIRYIMRIDAEVCAELFGHLHESIELPWMPAFEDTPNQPVPIHHVNDSSVALQTLLVLNDLNHSIITKDEAARRIRRIKTEALGWSVIKGGKE